MTCKNCGSYAINPGHHGREPGKNLHLCDVCYWRSEAARLIALLIEERVKFLAAQDAWGWRGSDELVPSRFHYRARREIEAEVLTETKKE